GRGLVLEFASHLLHVLRFLQQAPDQLHDRFSGFGHRGDALAVTHEDLPTQLVLELANLFGYTRLGGKELLRGFREVEALPDGLADIPYLLEIHDLTSYVRWLLNSNTKVF